MAAQAAAKTVQKNSVRASDKAANRAASGDNNSNHDFTSTGFEKTHGIPGCHGP